MSKPIQVLQTQANKWWSTITDPGTRTTYSQALAVTWTILKETGLLLWLVICLVLVVFDLFWAGSIRMGRQARDWWNNLDTSDSTQIASNLGTSLLSFSKSSLDYIQTQAREQLGLPEKQDAPVTTPARAPAQLTSAPTPSGPTPPPIPKTTSMAPPPATIEEPTASAADPTPPVEI